MKKILFFAVLLMTLAGCGKAKIIWKKSEPVDLEKLQVNLYVENSGSMDGYMHDGYAFKDAVFGYMTSINKFVGDTKFYYINSKILPNNISLENLSQSFDVGAFRKAGGDRGSTDLASILKMVLEKTDNNNVSVFVSDCILALPKGAAKNYFINNQIAIEAIVGKKLKKQKDLTFVVYRLTSHFCGHFYNANGSTEIDAKRPYYVMLIGARKAVCQLMRKVSLENIPNANVTSVVAYTDKHAPTMTITNSTGRMFKDGKCTLLQDRGSNNYRIKILADLTSAFLDEKSLVDKSVYNSSDRQFKVEYVEKINDGDNPYTHIITVSAPLTVQPTEESITLKKPATPIWIEQANDNTGTFIGRKTTGIKYVLDGIGNAYDNDNTIELNFKIKRN